MQIIALSSEPLSRVLNILQRLSPPASQCCEVSTATVLGGSARPANAHQVWSPTQLASTRMGNLNLDCNHIVHGKEIRAEGNETSYS